MFLMLYRLPLPIALGIASLLWMPTASAQASPPLNQQCIQTTSYRRKQPASPEITVAELNFDGDLQMPAAEQAKIAAALKNRVYDGPPKAVANETAERVRGAWQEHGYFKADISNYDFTVLTSSPVAARIAISLHVDEGQQYRLRQISFEDNKVIRNVQALRRLFPLKDGDIFSTAMVREGLDNLRRAYRELGYINFTSVPDTQIDEQTRTVSLVIDMDEGRPFYIRSVKVIGLENHDTDSALKQFSLERGRVYDSRLVQEFFNTHASGLPPDSVDWRVHRRLDEQNGTAAVTHF